MNIFRTRANNKIAVLGGGSWGTALAIVASMKNFVKVWEYDNTVVRDVEKTRINSRYLPGIKLSDDILFTSDMKSVLEDKPDMIIFAVPSHVTRLVAEQASQHTKRKAVVISASKGLEKGTFKRMSEVLTDCFPKSYPVIPLLGPTHAEEVAKLLPSAIVAGSRKKKATSYIQEALSTPTFRIYANSDTIGVEIASALKNVIAIAAGLSDGLGFGDNTKSALITRGLAEMVRFGKKFKAKERTFYGLAGVGDLMTTCFSEHGRNLRLGRLIARGEDLKSAKEKLGQECEGIKACATVREIALQKKIDMPISMVVYDVLFEGLEPKKATIALMERKIKHEHWGTA